jgi:AcrR family transcriptional regulator
VQTSGTADMMAPRPPGQLRADARQNHARLVVAATQAFAEKGADAPLEDVARRAGVGIGTLYRHFPTRLDLQAAVFRSQVESICGQGQALLADTPPGAAFVGWLRSLAAYFAAKRGLSKVVMYGLGKDSEMLRACSTAMRDTTERLLTKAQEAGAVRPDVAAIDILRLMHGIAITTEASPEQGDHLLSIMLDGLGVRPGPDSTIDPPSTQPPSTQPPSTQPPSTQPPG